LIHVARILDMMSELQEYYDVKGPEKKKRLYGEISSDADFDEKCLSYKKGCAIGLLPAYTIIDYELENFNNHNSTLATLDQKAKSMPIHYSWINITCHPEWLKHFDVDQFQVPTVVYYYP